MFFINRMFPNQMIILLKGDRQRRENIFNSMELCNRKSFLKFNILLGYGCELLFEVVPIIHCVISPHLWKAT